MKTCSADEAVALIRPGSRVFVAGKAGTPLALLDALVRRGTLDVELIYFLLDGVDIAAMIAKAPSIRHRPLYVGDPLTRAQIGAAVSPLPLSLPDASMMITGGKLRFDVVLVAVSSADQTGTVSLGPAVGLTRAVLERTPLALAEMVPTMPNACGDTRWPVASFATVTESARALAEFRHAVDDERSERIARYVSHLVRDGATLQVGPGRVPNGALRFLHERRNLRVLTDVLSGEFCDLIESRAVDFSASSEVPDADPPVMASYVTGTHRHHRLLNANERYTFWPIAAVTDPIRLASRRALVSITQALAIDLTGEACCETIGPVAFGGLASQPEFMRAAARSADGRSIVCLYASSEDGISAIRAALEPGESVSVTRSDVHFVVTEWGIAYLHGKSIEERALALIEIAHPDHRQALLEKARALALIDPAYRTANAGSYRLEDEQRLLLRDGRHALIRPTRLDDVPALQRLFHHFSREDIYLRFFRQMRALSVREAVRLCASEHALDSLYVVSTGEREAETLVASGCFFGDPARGLAEVGYLVDPDWQGTGLGRALQAALVKRAQTLGFRGLSAQILADNGKMLALARASGLAVHMQRDGDTCEMEMLWD